jgi:outer membrane protein assembly factor BamB
VIEGDQVLVTANTAGLALDKASGQLVWGSETPPKNLPNRGSYATSGSGYSTPVIHEVDGKRRALFASWKGVCSVDLDSGTPQWLHAWGFYTAGQGGDPVVVDGKILLTSDAARAGEPAMSVLLDTSGGQARVAWQSLELWTEFGTPVIVAGYIYSPYSGPTFRGGSIRCIELGTGRLMWEHSEASSAGGRAYSLMAADGKLIILDDLGNLVIAEANPTAYREISSCDVFGGKKKQRKFWTPPVLCGGRIYCRNYAGELLCIDVSR